MAARTAVTTHSLIGVSSNPRDPKQSEAMFKFTELSARCYRWGTEMRKLCP